MDIESINLNDELAKLYEIAIEKNDYTLALRILKEMPQQHDNDIDIDITSLPLNELDLILSRLESILKRELI